MNRQNSSLAGWQTTRSSIVTMLFYYCILYLAPSLLFSAVAILATWRRGQWWLLDFVVIPLPGIVWFRLMNASLRPKSFSNLGGELLALSALLAALLFLRGWVGTRVPRVISSLLLMFVSLLFAAGIFYLVPMIPD